MKQYFILTILTILIPTTSIYCNNNHIGTVAIVKGNVWIVKADNKQKTKYRIKISKNFKLSEKDEIITDNKAYVKILMKDDTIIDLGASTHFRFDKFKFKTKSNRKTIFSFLYGKMRSLFVVKAKPGDILIKTPSVSMGVRGTEILSDVYADATGEIKTDIALLSGQLKLDFSKELYEKSGIQSFTLQKGAIFSSNNFKKIKHLRHSIKNLSKLQLWNLKSKSPMKTQGRFLFDVLNHGKSFPRMAKTKLDKFRKIPNMKNENASRGIASEKIKNKQKHKNKTKRKTKTKIKMKMKKQIEKLNSSSRRPARSRPKCKMKKRCISYKPVLKAVPDPIYSDPSNTRLVIVGKKCVKYKTIKVPRNCR